MRQSTDKRKYEDPRRPIGIVKIPGFDRRVFEPCKVPLKREVAKLLRKYELKEVLQAWKDVEKLNEYQLNILARFGVELKGK